MDSLDTFIFYDKIFSNFEIEKLLKFAYSATYRRREDSMDRKKINLQNGNRDIAINSDLVCEKLDYDMIIYKYIKSLPEKYAKHIRIKKQYFADSKITRYNAEDDYNWHTDFANNLSGVRFLSSITYLNDDYLGGETEFFGKIISPKKGKTLIFPSTIMFPHRGKPIIKGKKYIFVSHITFSHLDVDKNNPNLYN